MSKTKEIDEEEEGLERAEKEGSIEEGEGQTGSPRQRGHRPVSI